MMGFVSSAGQEMHAEPNPYVMQGPNPLPRQSQAPDPTVDLPLSMEETVDCRNGLKLIEPKDRMV
jgi:hypothetical protein